MNREERAAWGPLIRESRRAQGITQDDLAQMAGTTRRTIGSIEAGKSAPHLKILERVLAVLGLQESPALDGDVLSFLALLGPLLQRMSPTDRAYLMPELVRVALGDDSPTTPEGSLPNTGETA